MSFAKSNPGLLPGKVAARLWVAALIVVATIIHCVRYSLGPMMGDESLTYFTVNQPSLLQLVHFQSTTPIVLEPPSFELLAHVSGSLFHYSPTSLRIISILSVTLIQICLYRIIKPIGGVRAAFVAMVLVLALPIKVYWLLLRPYAFLMAMSMAAFCCWQQAAYGNRFRKLAVTGIVVSLGLAITCHFYGILVLIPIIVGELHRTYQSHKIDIGIWTAVSLGVCSIALDIPFWMAPIPYKEHMPRDFGLGFRSIWVAYRELLVPFDRFQFLLRPPRGMAVLSVLLTIVAIASLYFSYRHIRSIELGKYAPVWTALVTLTLLPFLCVFIAYYYTHTFGPRHCCECALGALAIFAIALSGPLEQLSTRWTIVLAGLALIYIGARHVRPLPVGSTTTGIVAEYSIPPQIGSWLNSHPDQPIYADVDSCLAISMSSDPKLFPHVRCIYSREREIKYCHRQITYLTEMSLAQHTSFPMQFVSYEEFRRQLPTILLHQSTPWEEWIPDSLHDDGARLELIDHRPGDHPGAQFYFVTEDPPISIASVLQSK
jgi:hypothetical protein